MDFHTPLDTLETVDPEKIVQCVKEGCRLTEILSENQLIPRQREKT